MLDPFSVRSCLRPLFDDNVAMYKPIALKNLRLTKRVIQSPMAGCTDLAFRLLAREYGMEFAFLEMVSSEALVRESRKTADLLKTAEADRPLGAQLVGCNADVMANAAEMIEGMGFDLLDLNLGCPVPKITSPGGGSALLKEPEKAKAIFHAVMKKIKKIPVTVKMRLGFEDGSGKEAAIIAKHAEDAGFSAVAVHGRTRKQGYTGIADWEAIARVKQAVSIPVWGNGDVFSGEAAIKMLATTGCDGVMVGRGALGNPWLYKNIENAMNQLPLFQPCLDDLKKAALRHLELEEQTEDPRSGLMKSRRIACWYFKNQPGVHRLRDKLHRSMSFAELREHITSFHSLPGEAVPIITESAAE